MSAPPSGPRRRCQMFRAGLLCGAAAERVIGTIPLCEAHYRLALQIVEDALARDRNRVGGPLPAPLPKRVRRPRPAYDANGMRSLVCVHCNQPFLAPKKSGRPPRIGPCCRGKPDVTHTLAQLSA